MPELPEVETIRRHLAPHVEGRVLAAARGARPALVPPARPATRSPRPSPGRRVEALARRGKYLVWELEDDVHLVLHLRMTGTLLLDPPEPPRLRAACASRSTAGASSSSTTRAASAPASSRSAGRRATRSSRRGSASSRSGRTSRSAHLYALTRVSRAPIKAFLLDQRKVAGVGNIYADEALFRARVHPLRPARQLTRAQVAALRDGVVAALEEGLAAKGASIDDFRHPDGVQGTLPGPLPDPPARGRAVPGLRPSGAQAASPRGRGTYVCERCQPRPRPRRTRATAAR